MHLKGTVNDFRETLLLFEIKPKKKQNTHPPFFAPPPKCMNTMQEWMSLYHSWTIQYTRV